MEENCVNLLTLRAASVEENADGSLIHKLEILVFHKADADETNKILVENLINMRQFRRSAPSSGVFYLVYCVT